MMALPQNEEKRLEALHRYRILDTPEESDFDDVVRLAAKICDTPISLISLVDRDRQWFKGRFGLSIQETPRSLSFCSHTIQKAPATMVVGDAAEDARFATNTLVTEGPRIRFYAGAPLVTPEGYALGTLCVIDTRPRELSPLQLDALAVLSRQVIAQLELRRRLRELAAASISLTEANAELQSFAHAISHDLRAPLRAVISYSEIVQQMHSALLDDSVRGFIENIRKHSSRMAEILEGFLRLLRVRDQPLEAMPIEMDQMVKKVVSELPPLTDGQPKPLFELGTLPDACGDAGLIRQVWVNLLSNAVKFSRSSADPKIMVKGQRKGDQLIYTVRDNGCGFAPSDAEKLWQPFVRLHSTGVEGSGLGLSIVKRVVERHGGKVWAESNPGEYAAFHFALPASPPFTGKL